MAGRLDHRLVRPRLGLSIFDSRGDYGRTIVLEQDQAIPVQRGFWPDQGTRDGTILAVHRPEAADTVVIQLRDGEGKVRSSLGTHPGSEPYIHAEGTDRSMLFWKIFGGSRSGRRGEIWSSSVTPAGTN